MTPLFEWKPEHSVGIERFDREHRVLFGLLNELSDAMTEGRGRIVVSRILRSLSDYCQQHFSAEEEAMRNAGYPGLAAHIGEHQWLTEQVQKHYDNYTANSILVPIDVLYFLRDWLLHHICETDRSYRSHLNQAGIR